MPSRASLLLVASILLPACFAFPGDQKKTGPINLTQAPNQTAQIRNLVRVTALQKCENWAWAAALEMSLRMQGVPLDQKFWTDKVFGGAKCLQDAGSMEDLAKQVAGEYILPDNRVVKLDVRWEPTTPGTTDRILVPIALGHPYILYWRGHAYVPEAAVWDEYTFPTGNKLLDIKELTLIDPYEKGEQRVKFVKDNANELGGMFEVLVTEMPEKARFH